MDGEMVFLYLYSTGVRFNEEHLKDLLKNPEDFSKYEYNRPAPEEISTFNIPVVFNLSDESLSFEGKSYKLKMQVAIYPIGTFSIRVRHAFSAMEGSVLLDLSFDPKIKAAISAIVQKNKVRVVRALSKIKPIRLSEFEETYRFYYLEGNASTLSKKILRMIAGLLIDEKNVDKLDEAYVGDVLSKHISYDDDDSFFVGWESCVFVDVLKSYEHELLISEVANLQLLEMRTYHKKVSSFIDATEKIASRHKPNILKRMFGKEGREVRAIHFTIGEFYNTTRGVLSDVRDTAFGLGEWYLSKLYLLFFNVFKIDAWEKIMENDLDIIDKRRDFTSDILRADYEDALEITVIVLVVIELTLILFNIHVQL